MKAWKKSFSWNANEMTRAWKRNPKYWQQISLSKARTYANKGYFVVAGFIATGVNESGHVVVILPEAGQYSPNWGGNVPVTMDTGSGKRWDDRTLNWSFGTDKKNNITYYYYKH